MTGTKVIAWDFDGVLNRNIVGGKFLWAKDFERDLGKPLCGFEQQIFRTDFDAIITGQEDLKDRVSSWASSVGFSAGPDAVLDYWFKKDNLPDDEILELLDKLSVQGIRQVIATNNEARRTRYIETEMEFEQKVEMVFASGQLGVRKPNPAFYSKVVEGLSTDESAMILVDDCIANVEQARRLGWTAFHFTDESRNGLEEFLLNNLFC